MSEYSVDATVNRERQNQSKPPSGCFVHLLRAKAYFPAILIVVYRQCFNTALNLRGKTSAVGDFLEAIRHIHQNCV